MVDIQLTEKDWQKIKQHPFYNYIEKVESGEYNVGKYVKMTVKDVKESIDSEKYILDVEHMEKITNLTKLLNFADGVMRGEPIHDGLADFQWFLLISVLCLKYKEDTNIRRYRNAVMLIARKNGKVLPPIEETL